MMDLKTGSSTSRRVAISIILLVLGIAYMGLAACTFALGINLSESRLMQYLLHAVLILTAVCWVIFSDTVSRNNPGNPNSGIFLLFAGLFALPVLTGRTLGLYALSLDPASPLSLMLNFYAEVSISRTIEMVSWTLLFPVSVLFLGFIFLGQRSLTAQVSGIVSVLSALCSFTAFFYIIAPRMTLLWIGITGWGALLIIMLVTYIYGLLSGETTV